MVQNMKAVLKQKASNGELDQHSQNEIFLADGQSMLVVIHYEPQTNLYWIDIVNRDIISVDGNKKLYDVIIQGLELPQNTLVKRVEYCGTGDGEDWIHEPLHRGKHLYDCSLEELRELDAFSSNLFL